MDINLWIGSDHGGFILKQQIFNAFKYLNNFSVHDLGCYNEMSCDYPQIAKRVCDNVNMYGGYGILICTTGQGMCISANKQPNIIASLVHNEETAKLAREHNNANVICLGSKFTTLNDAITFIRKFITTTFSSEERHTRRLNQIHSF